MKYTYPKGSEIDFYDAPEWALFRTRSHYFEGFSNGLRWASYHPVSKQITLTGAWEGNTLDSCYNHHEDSVIAERRPIVWDGTGLPPVGTECLYMGTRVEIIGNFKNNAAMTAAFINCDGDMKTVKQAIASCFAPIRSPQDMARIERNETITSISEFIVPYQSPMDVAAALYDAGYRKCKK